MNDVANLSYTGKTVVQVSAYYPTTKKLGNIPIVLAAVAFDDAAVMGEAYVVIINQASIFWATFGKYSFESQSVLN